MNSDIWQPKYTMTNAAVNGLTRIEAARAVVENAALPPAVLGELSRQARIRATHYSTRIEGNRLTIEEAVEVLNGRRRVFHGRERDVAEVRNYWDALARVEEWASKERPVTEKLIRRIAAVALNGKRAKPEPYRTKQNVIRDSISGAIVYLPPEALDVARLMSELVEWIRQAFAEQTPPVVIAALAHYQFVTIHPYYDGNGRTGRLLATYVLHSGGYGLQGVFSLEEYHSRDIAAYYGALDVGGHHNYYLGRADADLTPWLEYFIATLADVFESARQEAVNYAQSAPAPEPEELRRLDRRARVVLALFSRQEEITSGDVAQTLGLSDRMARLLLAEWVVAGWLVICDPSRKGRKYALSAPLRSYMRERSR
ncbi:MAG: Fic family protein [Armatimonadota bacterium]|nr:Fic family protein [Armatimonadota bacterium]